MKLIKNVFYFTSDFLIFLQIFINPYIIFQSNFFNVKDVL